MPIGAAPISSSSGPRAWPASVGSSLASSPAGKLAAAYEAGPDVWEHYTFTVAQQQAGPVITCKTGQYTRLRILERSGNTIYVGLGRPITPAVAGAYDDVRPGSGESDDSIPATTMLYLALDPSEPAPTKNLEVWALGGVYTVRPT